MEAVKRSEMRVIELVTGLSAKLAGISESCAMVKSPNRAIRLDIPPINHAARLASMPLIKAIGENNAGTSRD